jgi:hypothetical protein
VTVVAKGRILVQAWKELITLTPVDVSSYGYPVGNDSLDNCLARSFAFVRNKYDCLGDETMKNEQVEE